MACYQSIYIQKLIIYRYQLSDNMTKPTAEDIEVFNSIFKPLISDKKGINKAKLIKLLANHHKAVQEVIRVYHHVTNGIITNILTPATEVIDAITQLDNQNLEAILKDEKEKWTKEQILDSVEPSDDTCYIHSVARLNQYQSSYEVILPTKKKPEKYKIVLDSRNFGLTSNKAIPGEWFNVIQGGVVTLSKEPEKKELMVRK
jgi:hypothetical protein